VLYFEPWTILRNQKNILEDWDTCIFWSQSGIVFSWVRCIKPVVGDLMKYPFLTKVSDITYVSSARHVDAACPI